MIRPRTGLLLLLLSPLSPLVRTPLGTQALAQTACTPGVTADCDDGDPCTRDGCLPNGVCFHFRPEDCTPCLAASDCDDGDPCTADVCDAGACRNDRPPEATCDDGDPCTTGDTCRDGACTGTPLACSDGVACTDDACEGGACVHRPSDAACGSGGECVALACRPGEPAADARGCAPDPAPFDGGECSPDGDACTVDRCRAAICGHDVVENVAQCNPVRPSYNRAVDLRAGVERLLNFVAVEAPVGGDSGAAVVAQLAGLREDLEASVRALGGVETGRSLPPGARPRLPANPTVAQLRGSLAMVWLRGAPVRAGRFLGAVSRGRRRGDVPSDVARELRRNGRILLADTKALKRDVKNLQKTFSIFQR